MSWIRYISILIMISLVCSARTCNEDEETIARREEQTTFNLIDSVKDAFMSDSLTDQSLRAYELNATGKLIDFADYMKIISDSSLDMKFRDHAAGLVRDLFIHDETELPGWSKPFHLSELYTLEQLLSYSLAGEISYSIKPSEINIVEPFTSTNDSVFTGRLLFKYKLIPLEHQDSAQIASGKLMIDIYLVRILNSFGKDKFRVWEVYLGDIR